MGEQPAGFEETLSESDAERIAMQASLVFTPATPVAVRELFAGRTEQLMRVLDAVNEPGLHVVLFGERGVGKTSLANIISMVASLHDRVAACRITCESNDSFASLWHKALSEIRISDARPRTGFAPDDTPILMSRAEQLQDTVDLNAIDAHGVRLAFASLPTKAIVVFDEFDRLETSVARAFTDAIKTLSDTPTPLTIVLVGVADTVDRLVGDHESIARSLVQIQMPRMHPSELEEIVKKGATKLKILFDSRAIAQIVTLSQGLPHYTHLIARNAARVAARRHSVLTTADDVSEALKTAVADAEQSIKTRYHKAVQSSHKAAIFRQVLLACALTKKNELNCFQAADVVQPMKVIMGKKYEIAAFARHLSKFCMPERGSVLQKNGEERRFRFRFSEPLLPTFIIMSGIADGIVTPEKIGRLS